MKMGWEGRGGEGDRELKERRVAAATTVHEARAAGSAMIPRILQISSLVLSLGLSESSDCRDINLTVRTYKTNKKPTAFACRLSNT